MTLDRLRPLVRGFSFVLLAIVLVIGMSRWFEHDAEHTSAPPHVAPPAAEAPDTSQLTTLGAAETETVALFVKAKNELEQTLAWQAAVAALARATRPEVRSPSRVPSGSSAGTPTDLGPCGGDLPPCYVKNRESHGDYAAKNPRSTASGAWQFLDSTWAGYGGYARASDAPPEVQDERAAQLWAGGAGCRAWSAC